MYNNGEILKAIETNEIEMKMNYFPIVYNDTQNSINGCCVLQYFFQQKQFHAVACLRYKLKVNLLTSFYFDIKVRRGKLSLNFIIL